MKHFCILATFLSGALFASPAFAKPLWQDSESGMTASQIKTLFPNAKPGKQTTLFNGATCKLSIEYYEIAEDSFTVCFFFLDDALSQVTLSADSPSELKFRSFADLLRAKYGPELAAGQNRCRYGTLTNCSADWSLSSGTNVNLLFIQVGSAKGTMNINYQTRTGTATSKL